MLVIIDFNRTLYDPDSQGAVAGATEMLRALVDKGARLVLVSSRENEPEDIRRKKLAELGIAGFFDEILFVDSKDAQLFAQLMLRYCVVPEQTYVIGDYLHDEIRAGNQSGAITIRLKQGKHRSLQPEVPEDEPTATVGSLCDIPELVH